MITKTTASLILQTGLIVKIRISRSANKFLEKLDANSRKSVLTKIGILKTCLETQNVYPPEELDIKKLALLVSVWKRGLY
ncbi:MAG: hypothetical protein GPI93_18915 [Microcystis aeruginosa LG13-12]|nr:hypothetical protein [Microcystis aeruginosa LG13-12]